MTPLAIKWVANYQKVSKGCIYNRLNAGWSTNEILQGRRDGKRSYTKPVDTRYDLASGQTAFMVLLFDVIRAITGLSDSDNYPLTLGVFYGLLERKV